MAWNERNYAVGLIEELRLSSLREEKLRETDKIGSK